MRRAVVVVVALFVALTVFWFMGFEAAPEPSPATPVEPARAPRAPLARPARVQADSPKEAPLAEPDSEPEREAPSTPELEGLFALADAAGQGLVKCDASSLPDAGSFDAERVGDLLYVRVRPSGGGLPNSMNVFGDVSFDMKWQDDVYPGGPVAPCTLNASVKMTLVMNEDQVPQAVEDANADASATLDDAEEEMMPEQVALDTPGLSAGARAWLQARIEAELDDAEATEAEPVTEDTFLDRLDEIDSIVVE